MTTKQEREAREAAAGASEATDAAMKRIAAALEALVDLGVAIKAIAEREIRARRVFPPDEGEAK